MIVIKILLSLLKIFNRRTTTTTTARTIWVYVVASGFGMLVYRGADIPISSRLVLNHRDFQLLLLSPTYVKGHVLQLTLYTIPFKCSFVGRSLGFLKT